MTPFLQPPSYPSVYHLEIRGYCCSNLVTPLPTTDSTHLPLVRRGWRLHPPTSDMLRVATPPTYLWYGEGGDSTHLPLVQWGWRLHPPTSGTVRVVTPLMASSIVCVCTSRCSNWRSNWSMIDATWTEGGKGEKGKEGEKEEGRWEGGKKERGKKREKRGRRKKEIVAKQAQEG